ncbi:MAG: hypothetical protein GX358_11955 [candidate division WS1 bacterium]|nr:hypothetical protein [candidate division WS1 bacterium]
MRTFGEIPGIKVGQLFANRRELHDSGVHRPLQAGICGSADRGAESVVLSGGYEDDEDLGDEIIYTGHGGQDRSGVQIADQKLVNQNAALAQNAKKNIPVRLIRGARLRSPFAPVKGFRYDGLFDVKRYWQENGKAGHLIWRFHLVKRASG